MAFTKDANDDNLTNIRDILRENWDADNVKKPVIFKARNAKRALKSDLSQSDKISIYNAGYTNKPADLGYGGKTGTQRISIDLRCNGIGGEARVVKMRNEVERILNSYRKNPQDDNGDQLPFNDMTVGVSEVDLSDGDKGFYRWVFDIVLNIRYQAVST